MKASLVIFSALGVLARGQLEAATQQGKLRQANDAPEEFDVDASATYDSEFMGLMNSPCRPEHDGYFGATSGFPTEIHYGFKIETLPLASITNMLDIVEDRVVDGLIATSFPSLCGFRRRQLESESDRRLSGESTTGATGFWFSKFSEVQTECKPEFSELNYCGVFQGKVQVFGKSHEQAAWDILAILEAVLNNPTPSNMHSDLVSIGVEERLTAIVGEPSSMHKSDNKNELSEVAKAGIIVSVVVVICAIFYFYMGRKSASTSDGILRNDPRKSKRSLTFYDRVMGRRTRARGRRTSSAPQYPSPTQYRDHKADVLAMGNNTQSGLTLPDARPDPLGYDPTQTSDISESQGNLDDIMLNDECRPSLDPRAEFS